MVHFDAVHRCAQVPECYEEPLLRFVHHATGSLEDVAAQAVAEFQHRIIVGEEATARVGEAERPCAVLSITSVDHISGVLLCPSPTSYIYI